MIKIRKTLEIVRFRGFLSVSIWNVVRVIGLEPTRLTTPDPKSGAATNYATGAAILSVSGCKGNAYF